MVLATAACVESALAQQAPPTEAEFAEGEQLFSQICSHCHGPHMVNPGTVAFDLRKFPHDDRARFFNSVRNGKNNMPPWKDVLKPDEIEALWAYVRSGGKAP
jgi:mono/diheme cytochrome c family protein